MDETEETFSCPPWSELPGLVVENIYCFLNRSDQKSMSLVCRNWREEYSSPRLWRKVTFHFPDTESNFELCPDVIFARRYGSMFRHVEIEFQEVQGTRLNILKTYLRQFEFFLESVTLRSQLKSFSMKNMWRFFASVPYQNLDDFYPTILNLIKSQKELQFVEIGDIGFIYAQVGKILTTLFVNNCNTLRHLHLTGFILEESPSEFANIIFDDDVNLRVFMNLEVLSISYTVMLEKMMLSFYESRNKVDTMQKTGSLKEIKFECDVVDPSHYIGIHRDVWKYFMNVFPSLRVDFNLSCRWDPEILLKFVVPHMPLRLLYFCLPEFTSSPDIGVGTLLHHITSCGLNNCLEVLVIEWHGEPPNLAPDLISVTNDCSVLKDLEIIVEHPKHRVAELNLDTVFDSWLENRPQSLNGVRITIFPYIEEDEAMLSSLSDLYAPLLELLGISLSLSIY